MARDNVGNPGLDGFFVTDVEGQGLAATAIVGDLCRNRLQLGLGAAADDDGGAQGGQFMGDTATDAAAAPGYPVHLAG